MEEQVIEKYTGYYDRTIFYNPVNKYCILSIKTDDTSVPEYARSKGYTFRDHLIRFVVVGYDLPRTDALEMEWEGAWKNGKYGYQFETAQWKEIIPKTIEGIEGYLASGLLKGIGEKTAAAIVARFGLSTLDVLENEPEKLLEIRGITEERLADIKQSYAESRSLRDLMTLLSPFKVTPKAAQAIYKFFGSKCIEILKSSPFQLCKVPGFGFHRVDAIVQKNGGKLDDPMRIQAALLYTLEDNKSKHGHLYVEKEILLDKAFELVNKTVPLVELRISMAKIESQFQELFLKKEVVVSKDCIYLPKAFELEDDTARRGAEILLERPSQKNISTAIREVRQQLGIVMSPKQELAVEMAFQHNLSIITGGPGTGKTTVLKAILGVYQKTYPGCNVLLAAPTGRASRRMTESTGYLEAKTLHSTLRLGTEVDTLQEARRDPIPADLIIVDETSMVDQWLAKQFFSRIAPGTKTILVGDADQLPSVGAGNVFRELIGCGLIPVTKLDQIFRQAEDSRIAHNAKYINASRTDLLYGDDFMFIRSQRQSEAAEVICSLYYKLVEECGVEKVLILSPFRTDGEASAEQLNAVIREHLNPYDEAKGELRLGKKSFRIGDRVMQTRNDYNIALYDHKGERLGSGVYNGDIGTIISIDQETVIVDYEGRIAIHTLESLGDLTFAYATTVHKAMGSECENIIMPILRAHAILLNRNLVYTAITRAKKRLFLVGQKDALFAAIHRQKIDQRNTMLGHRLALYYKALTRNNDHIPSEWKEAV